ncbi:MAG TPA: hypothetical protein PLA90_10410, partial [Candidatus Sumerlaeota bacterium]|nr:hypothetical protein [Candidatus Sumerlaeota bacterium]
MNGITARFKQLIETLSIACLLVLVFTGSSAEKKSTQPEELTNSIGMKFKLIPAGSFLMGASDYDKRTYRVGWPRY